MRHRRVRHLTLLATVAAALLAATVIATGGGGAAANESPALATASADLPPTGIPSPTDLPTGTAGPTDLPTGTAAPSGSPSPTESGCGDECGVCAPVDASAAVTHPVAYRQQRPPVVPVVIKFRANISYTVSPQIQVTVPRVDVTPPFPAGGPKVGVKLVFNPRGYEVSIELCNLKTCENPTFEPVYPALAGYLAGIAVQTKYLPVNKPTRFVATIQADSIKHTLVEPFNFTVTCFKP